MNFSNDKEFSKDDFQLKQKTKLPSDFAEQILDLEILMEEEPIDFYAIQSLADHYHMAIQYYTELQSKRKDIFLRKYQILYKKPQVIEAQKLHKEKVEKELAENKQTTINRKSSQPDDLFQLTLKNEIINASIKRSNIQNLMEQKQKKLQANQELINQDINNQQELIKKRIQLQKMKKQKLQDEIIKKNLEIQNHKQNIDEKKQRALKMLKIYQKVITKNMTDKNAKEIILKNQRISKLDIDQQNQFQKFFDEHKNDNIDNISQNSENSQIKDKNNEQEE